MHVRVHTCMHAHTHTHTHTHNTHTHTHTTHTHTRMQVHNPAPHSHPTPTDWKANCGVTAMADGSLHVELLALAADCNASSCLLPRSGFCITTHSLRLQIPTTLGWSQSQQMLYSLICHRFAAILMVNFMCPGCFVWAGTICTRAYCHAYWGCRRVDCNGCLAKFKGKLRFKGWQIQRLVLVQFTHKNVKMKVIVTKHYKTAKVWPRCL